MKLLYISYSCNPLNGSEDQIGWNIPIASETIGNDVYVITKKEHKESITQYMKTLPLSNIKFDFVDIPQIYKKIFFGVFYSMRIILWQKRAIRHAKRICIKEDIELIHQVAPVEFRALGNYGKIRGIPFVAGPIGGGYPVPKPLNAYVKGHFFLEILRKILNTISFVILKINKRIEKCSYIFFTNEEVKNMLDKFHFHISKNSWEYHCDIGISDKFLCRKIDSKIKNEIVFFVPGRLNYRKGHKLLFDAIPRNIDETINFSFRIAGEGPFESKLKAIVENDVFLQKHISFIGRIPFEEMADEYEQCSAVILPSLSEATGTVLIEGMAKGKPVIAAKHFGAKILVDDSCGWLFDGHTKEELVEDFRRCMSEAINYSYLLKEKGENAYMKAAQYSWKSKVTHFNDIYKFCIVESAKTKLYRENL